MNIVQRIGYIPVVARLYAKYGYPAMTRVMRSGDEVLFLGPGYEEDPAMGVALAASDERDRYPIQLYHRLATEAALSGKKVLEVSCGHGGGASYLTRTFTPASYTGLDLNPAGIAFCRKRHNLPGLDFVEGDAENLPFPDESFDVVINVEASHSYPHFPVFLNEVARVLKPEGRLLYTDTRIREYIPAWEADLEQCSMRTLSRRVINPEIVRGYELNSRRRQEQIDHYLRFIPRSLRSYAGDFSGVEGGGNYRALQNGDLSYQIWIMAKS